VWTNSTAVGEAVHVDVYVDVHGLAEFFASQFGTCGTLWAGASLCEPCGIDRAQPTPMLAHEKLDVYQCAVEFLAPSTLLIDGMPPGTTVLRDQLERASLSIVANVAEAGGVRTPKERERHFGIARGSAMECGALLDACRLRRVCTLEQQQQAKQMLVRIVSMLTRLVTPLE